MKKNYNRPEIFISEFDKNKVITMSGDTDGRYRVTPNGGSEKDVSTFVFIEYPWEK